MSCINTPKYFVCETSFSAFNKSDRYGVWIETFVFFFYNLNPTDFLHPPRAGLRGHTYRLLQGLSRLRRRSGASSVRVVKYWSRLPAYVVLSPSVYIFKKHLDRQWSEILPAALVHHCQFSKCCYPGLFMVSLTFNPWPAYVVCTGPRDHSYH